jgi:hypothetical protein
LKGELDEVPWDAKREEAASTDPLQETRISNRFSWLVSGKSESRMAILMSVESSPEVSVFRMLEASTDAAGDPTLV